MTKGILPGLYLLLTATGLRAVETFTIRDCIGRDWVNEPIVWELPDVTADRVTLTRDGRAIPAQIVAAEGGIRVLFVIDRLARDGTTELRADFGAFGPDDTSLALREQTKTVLLDNGLTAVKLPSTGKGNGPLLGVRLPSGIWTRGSRYDCTTGEPVASITDVLERGPVRLKARVTTTFDNGRKHVVTVSVWAGSRSIEIDETFDIGPDDRYRFKQYGNDRDELAWEWWSWYGDKDGLTETHPNNWIVELGGNGFRPVEIAYTGCASTDATKGPTNVPNHQSPLHSYTLAHDAERRFEKYLVGHSQWRPDAVLWYVTSQGTGADEDALAVYTHSVGKWRNPNALPVPKGITLRTGVNDMRIVSHDKGERLEIECPIGLGRRTWAIRTSTRDEMLGPADMSPTALCAERVRRSMGLNITRTWVTEWESESEYPRLFIDPDEREAYYARLKGKGVGAPGSVMDTFLRNQDRAGFDKDYALIEKQADRMIEGYCSRGMDISVGYPGWMLGYWHGIIVASGLDNLLGSDLCTSAQAANLRKKLAILTYCLTSTDAWGDKQTNYGWGSMNMPVGRWGGLVVMASALGDHPMVSTWLKDANRYFDMLLRTEYSPDGVAISCPHYIGASSTSFYAWIAMAAGGTGKDVSTSPVLQNFARYYMQLMTPIDPRWGIRTLICEGDTRPGSSSLTGILGTLFRESNPELAGQLMHMWTDGGKDLSQGMGIADFLIIDPAVAAKPLALRSEVYPGFGAFLRRRELGTPQESYLAFVGGDFMIDHANTDQFAFHWHEKGVPLSVFKGSMYQPMTCTALSHNTISWDVRPGGAPDPGKGSPGNWYHDNDQPHVDLGGVTPTLHWQIGWDRETQAITETRGTVARAAECAGAALIEGSVTIQAMVETPTRADNDAIAIASQAWPPSKKLAKPFTWTRRLLSVQAPTAQGMNYLVIRDDFGGWAERTPSFNYWSLADSVALDGDRAHFAGALGVDTEMAVFVPDRVSLHEDTFTHSECEGIVAGRHRAKYGKRFSETMALCRVEGQKGQGFLVTLFPRRSHEPAPVIEPWLNGKGVEVVWQNETHYVLLDAVEHEIDANEIRAKASVLIVKITDAENFSLTLPLGGSVTYRGHTLAGTAPRDLVLAGGKPRSTTGTELLR